MECQACQLELEKLLCTLPSAWRKQVISVICGYIADQGMDCAKVAECIAADMTTLDYQCLADSQAEWDALTFNGKIQRIIDRVCAVAGLTLVTTANTNGIHLSGEGTATDALTATLQISSDAGNQAVIHSNGLFVPPAADIDICQEVQNAFADIRDQMNGSPRTGYEILARTNTGGTFDQGQCIELTPPTGFAVGGPGRVSAYGALEWFDTLTLANADAATGETVLIFADTAEDVTVVAGVSYHGVGDRTIGDMTMASATKKVSLANLSVTDLTVSGNTNVQATNFNVNGQATFSDNTQWDGGSFYGSSGNIIIQDLAKVRNIYSEKWVRMLTSSSLENFIINYTGGNSSAFEITSVGTTNDIYARNGHIKASTTYGMNVGVTPRSITLDSIVVECAGGNGMFLDLGEQSIDGRFILKNLIGIASTSGIGIDIVSGRSPGDSDPTISSIVLENCTGISNTGIGIQSNNGNLKRCIAYSNTDTAMQVGGSTQQVFNVNVIDCIAESKSNVALTCNGNIYVTGGTFVARGSTTASKPIVIADTTGHTNYFIAGVKTVATNTTVYGISGTSVTARISGCQFLNQGLLTAVPGIDPGITLRAVSIDAYGNMK